MRKLVSLAAAAAVAIMPATAIADDHEAAPTVRENARYLNIILVDIKPGKRDRAEEIIRDYFEKASEAAGTPKPVLVHLQTGEWDFLVVWRMEDGPVELTYTSNPDGPKWMAALAELAGGQDEAMALWNEYQSLISRSTSMIGHRHMPAE